MLIKIQSLLATLMKWGIITNVKYIQNKLIRLQIQAVFRNHYFLWFHRQAVNKNAPIIQIKV